MVNRIVVGAHYGLKDWLIQRITAVLIGVYSIILVGVLVQHMPLDFISWKAVFTPIWFRILTLMALVAVFWHAWIGMRDILMDYVKNTGVRLFLQTSVVLVLIFYGLWSATILWSV